MTGPLVSVIIPAYNGGDLLGEAVESVLAQSYANLELIVADDASTDSTGEVLARFSDSRLKVLRHFTNRGPDAGRLTALGESRGEVVAFLDQDDLFHPSKLECHVAFLEANPDVGFTYNPHFTLLHPVRRIVGVFRPPDPMSLADLVRGFPIAPSAWVARRAWIMRDDLWDERTMFRGREVVFCGRLFMAGCRFAVVNRVLNYRRTHVGRRFTDPVSKCRQERRCQEILLADPRCPPGTRAIRHRAAADNCLVWANVAFAQDDTDAGQALVREAIQLDPAVREHAVLRVVELLITHAVVDAEDPEAQLRKIFRQLPVEIGARATWLDWAVQQAYLVKIAQETIWGALRDGDMFRARAAAVGAKVDVTFLARACYELMSHQTEFGEEATRQAGERLAAALSGVEKNAGRRLRAAYHLARAFQYDGRGRRRGVAGHVVRAFAESPRYLTDRGAWSILLRSLVPRADASLSAPGRASRRTGEART